MGDYNVQIISAKIKKVPDEKLKEFEEELKSKLPLCDSAYHATAVFVSINNHWSTTVISIITQAKYNRGVDEFLDWLRPKVVGGMGPCDAWSINFSEYSKEPTILYMREEEPEL